MFNKLDRYIVNKFLVFLFFTVLAWIALFIIIDLTEHLNKFLSHHATISQVLYYYILYIPYAIVLTMPISVLIAVSFSFSTMAQHNEIIAMQASGVSLYRIMIPFFIIGFLISLIIGVSGETFVPTFNRTRLDYLRYTIKKEHKKRMDSRTNIVVKDTKNTICYIRYYNSQFRKANKVAIIQLDSANNIISRMDAKIMIWDSVAQNWLLKQVVKRELKNGERIFKLDTMRFIPQYMKPENLSEVEIKPEEMTFAELYRFIQRLENMGLNPQKWLVDLHMKISFPLTNLIVLLIGAPISSRKRRSGPALGIILGFVVSFIYFVFLRTGQVLGHRGILDPVFAAWMGNIAFGIIGILILIKIRK
jgi:lipopolysaccharide export system permease protein